MARRIQRFSATYTIASAAAEVVSGAISLNGLLNGILINSPNLDDTDTFTVTFKDADGNVLFTRATLAESVRHAITTDSNDHPLRIPLAGNHTVTITASGNQAADRDFDVVLLIARGF